MDRSKQKTLEKKVEYDYRVIVDYSNRFLVCKGSTTLDYLND